MSLDLAETPRIVDPLTSLDLHSLARDAARLRPGDLVMADSSGDRVDCAGLDARADAMAGRLASLGLVAGETLMIAGAAHVSTFIALLGGLRAGLDVALAPVHAPPPVLAAFATRVGADAITTRTAIGDYAPVDDMFEVAARSERIRLVCGLGPASVDGVVDIHEPTRRDGHDISVDHMGRIATFAPGGGVVYHAQTALALAALDVATRADVRGRPLVSALPPIGFAGLVAGPFLSLLTGSPLHYLSPFDAAAFLDDLRERAPAHLVAPGALAGPLTEAGLIRPDVLASLMLVDRTTDARGALAPLGDTRGVPIIDLHAFGEQAVIAERRGEDARPLPPARRPHIVRIDDIDILAVRRREGNGPLAFEGEAVSAA